MARYLVNLTLLLGLAFSVHAQNDSVTASTHFDNIEQKVLSLPIPRFPDMAKNAGLGGNLTVAVRLDGNGNVESAEFVAGPGNVCKTVDDRNVTELRKLAIEAAKSARFEPVSESVDSEPLAQIVYHFPIQENAPNRPVVYGTLNHRYPTTETHKSADPLPKPVYPPAARAVGASGSVDVRVVIDDTGKVFTAEVVSGHPLLRAVSIAAACESKLAPTLLDGKPVWMTGIVTYKFIP